MNIPELAIEYTDHNTGHTFHFPVSIFKKPNNIKEYSKLEKILDELIDEVRDDEKHPLAIVMQIIGENLEQYDNEHLHEKWLFDNEIALKKVKQGINDAALNHVSEKGSFAKYIDNAE